MSDKANTFVPSYLKPKTNRDQRQERVEQRKTGSYRPPPAGLFNADRATRQSLSAALVSAEATTPAATPFQGRTDERRETGMGMRMEPGDFFLPVNLTEAVAMVSAVLTSADHALVQAARWETLGDDVRARQMYGRSVMLESLAERIAKLSRQETK